MPSIKSRRNSRRVPPLLQIGVVALVAEGLVGLVSHPTAVGTAVVFATVVILAWGVLRGSRIAWLIVVLAAVAQLVGSFVLGQPLWLAGIATVYLICLVSPRSWAFVWTERRPHAKYQLPPAVQRVQRKLLLVVYGLIARLPWLAGRSAAGMESVDRYFRARLIVALVIAVVILIPLDSALYDLHKDSDSVVATILWRVTSVVHSVAQLGLIALLVLAGYRYVTRRLAHQSSADVGGAPSGFSQQLSVERGVDMPSQFPRGEYKRRPWDPRAYADEDRPRGWYINPDDPGKMHHWGGRDSPVWIGTTRTPRKIRRTWQAE